MLVRRHTGLVGGVHWWVWHKRVAGPWLRIGMLLRNEIGALSPRGVPGRGPRVMLRGMLPWWVRVERTVLDGRGRGLGLIPHVLKGGLVLELRGKHLLLDRSATVLRSARSIIIVIFIIILALPVEIGGAFVLICSSIL